MNLKTVAGIKIKVQSGDHLNKDPGQILQILSKKEDKQ